MGNISKSFQSGHFSDEQLTSMSAELTREQLYQLVWEKPLATVATELGLSIHALAKQCRKANVPTPTTGYWTKLAHGKTPRKPPLPLETAAPSPETHHSQWPRENSGLCERAQQLIAELTRLAPNYHGLQSLQDRHFPYVDVTKAMIEPAGRLFHAILIKVESSGLPFRKARSKYEGGYFERGSDRVYLEIKETLIEDPRIPSWSSQKKTGTGRLEVELRAQCYGPSWKKTLNQKDEGGVRELVSSVASAIEDYYRELERTRTVEAERRRIERERWLKEEDERKRHEHAEAVIDAKSVRAGDLFKAAEWARLHREALAFINECEARWKSMGGDLTPAQEAWLAWAKAEANVWSPWATGYPDPKSDGAYLSEDFPYGGPTPPVRNFPRPPTMPASEPESESSWDEESSNEPFPIRL